MEQFSRPIDDSLCIGQRRQQDKDERVLLFVKMRAGHKFTPQLVDQIKTAVRKGLSARHVPSYVFEVTDIPVSGTLCCVCGLSDILFYSTLSTVRR